MTPALIRAWQRIVGVPLREVDGKWGPKTDATARAWQTANGIEPDGVLGPLCRAKVEVAALIKPFEGFVSQTYDDERKSPLSARLLHKVGGLWIRADGFPCRGVPTIAWGNTSKPRAGIERCTRAEGDLWLVEDLEHERLPAVRRCQSPTWDAAQISAACCFAYNCGTGALASLAGFGFAADHWLAWDKTGGVHDAGLKMRREEELALFSDV